MNAEIIIITGAKRGIGQKIYDTLLKKGSTMISGTGSTAPAEKEPFLYQTDFLNPQSVQNFIRTISNYLEKNNIQIKALMNNAAIYGGRGNPPRTRKEIIHVNYKMPQLIFHSFKKYFSSNARIINISSGLGELRNFSKEIQHTFNEPALSENNLNDIVQAFIENKNFRWPDDSYGISKAALNTLTRIWHRKYVMEEKKQWKIISICPGWVKTRMGGSEAPLTVEQGADTPLWALESKIESGLFYRKRTTIPW